MTHELSNFICHSIIDGLLTNPIKIEVKHDVYGKRQTAGRRLPFAVCCLPFGVLSSCASASRTPESSRSDFSWIGLFSESLQCPPLRFREAPR